MNGFPAPSVATGGSTDPGAPLVVLLHGRGSHEREIISLAEHLPTGPAYAAVRAPIAEGGGYAWFANRGIGRPVPESLRATMDWFRAWLDGVAPSGRPVVLVGFSGGAAFAGGLLLDDPARYAGAAILYGTLPFDAGVPATPARLAGVPVVVVHGEQDTVIPRDLLDRTWQYLTTVAGWLSERLDYLARHGRPELGPQSWPTLPDGVLPARTGGRPAVSSGIPQEQRSDNAPAELQEQLFARVAAFPGVTTRQSAISVPGARGLMLTGPQQGPDDAFLVPSAGEFAHVHPGHDGSMHLALPLALATDLIAKGRGVAHPLAGVRLTPGMVMLFGPRDATELETVIVATSHAWAAGQLTERVA